MNSKLFTDNVLAIKLTVLKKKKKKKVNLTGFLKFDRFMKLYFSSIDMMQHFDSKTSL